MRRKKMSPIAIICVSSVVLAMLYFLISLIFDGRPDWWNAINWNEPMSGSEFGAFFLMVAAFMCVIYILYGIVLLLRHGPKGESVTEPAQRIGTTPQGVPSVYLRQRRGSGFGVLLAMLLGVIACFAVPVWWTVSAVYSQLQDESADARISAVGKVVEYGSGGLTRRLIGKRVSELLVDALRDEDSGVRLAAAQGLGQIGDENAVDALAAALKDENADVAFAALRALQSMNTGDSVTAIVNTLDGDAVLRQMSLCVLSEMDSDLAEQALENAPDASNDEASMKTQAVDALMDIFKGSDTDGQRRVIFALENIGTSYAAEALSTLLKTKDEEIRIAAARALVIIGNDSAVAALADALQTGSEALQVEAAQALKAIGSASATDVLISALQSEKHFTQLCAALALSGIDNSAAKEALHAAMAKQNLPVIAYIYDYYIQEGIVGSEPSMIEALNSFGYSVMAEAFLNRGNSTLEEAATDWADRYGYEIIRSSWGGDFSQWGSG